MNKEIVSIPIGLIEIPPRLRAVDLEYAEAIGRSIRDRGQDTPIWVSPAGPDGKHQVIAGAHRVKGCQLARIQTIEAVIFVGSLVEGKLLEIEENLQRRDLSALDRATFVAMHKKMWLVLHPEKLPGKAGADARWMRGSSSSPASFAVGIARTLGRSKGEVNKMVRRRCA
jgi:ParB family chromosome partitioning protein